MEEKNNLLLEEMEAVNECYEAYLENEERKEKLFDYVKVYMTAYTKKVAESEEISEKIALVFEKATENKKHLQAISEALQLKNIEVCLEQERLVERIKEKISNEVVEMLLSWFDKRFAGLEEELKKEQEKEPKTSFAGYFESRLKNQVRFYVTKCLKSMKLSAETKEWTNLEEAYEVMKGEREFKDLSLYEQLAKEKERLDARLHPKEGQKKASKSQIEEQEEIIENLERVIVSQDPEVLMFYAMEKSAEKVMDSLDYLKEKDREFKRDVVAMVTEECLGYKTMKAGKKDTNNSVKVVIKEPMYNNPKIENAGMFCAFFRRACMNRYMTEVMAELQRTKSFISYEVLEEKQRNLEKSDNALDMQIDLKDVPKGEREKEEADVMASQMLSVDGIEDGAEMNYGKSHLTEESALEFGDDLQKALRMILLQVSKGPVRNAKKQLLPFENIGGAFAKYVPALGDKFAEKNGRYELLEGAYQEGEELCLKVRGGAKVAATGAYEVLKNHTVLSAANLFSDVMESNEFDFHWSEELFNVVEHAGETKYGDEIKKVDTMSNHANKVHTKAIEASIHWMEEELEKLERDVAAKKMEEMKSLFDLLEEYI